MEQNIALSVRCASNGFIVASDASESCAREEVVFLNFTPLTDFMASHFTLAQAMAAAEKQSVADAIWPGSESLPPLNDRELDQLHRLLRRAGQSHQVMLSTILPDRSLQEPVRTGTFNLSGVIRTGGAIDIRLPSSAVEALACEFGHITTPKLTEFKKFKQPRKSKKKK